MKKIVYTLLVFIIPALLIVACKHTNDVTPTTQGGGSGTGNGNGTGSGGTSGGGGTSIDTSLCFERDVLPIFISNCAKSGCHDAASHQDGYVFTSYQTITAKKFKPGNPDDTELYEKITDNDPKDRMPKQPNAPLTAQQITIIYNWIARGAPNTTGCTSGCDSSKFTFSGAIQPLLNTYCRGCHNSTSASSGVNLDNYAGVKVVASDGRLVGVTKRLSGYPAMPKNGNKLSDCQLLQIEKWVNAGALNN